MGGSILATLHSATGVLLPAKNPAYFTRMVKKVDPRSRHPASWLRGEFSHTRAHIFNTPVQVGKMEYYVRSLDDFTQLISNSVPT